MTVVTPLGADALFHTPDEWVAVLRDVCEALATGLDRAVAEASRKIEEADPGLLEAMGFVAGPVLGALWSKGVSDHAKEELRARLAAAARDATAAVERLQARVFDEADEVMGDPARLLAAARSHLDAKERLDDVIARVHVSRAQVDRYWRGQSERAFWTATGFQVGAVGCFSQWLASAATMLSTAAGDIKHMWSRFLQVLVDFGIDLLRDIASAFDVGNVLAFEVGPILATVASCIDALAGVAQVVREAASEAETVMTTQWEVISSSPEVPGGRWPLVDDLDLSDLSDPDRWKL